MGIVIGIDVGGSTTKIVGLNKGKIQSPMFITAADPVTSLFGAFGKYIYDNGIHLSDVEQVMLCGQCVCGQPALRTSHPQDG